jgi:uroporphyrinogen decarboxylase
MNTDKLKKEFGNDLTFWGGGVETQKTLPFGTSDQVRNEIKERLGIFKRGGGFVFNPVHNVQSNTPVENLIAMYETVKEFGKY